MMIGSSPTAQKWDYDLLEVSATNFDPDNFLSSMKKLGQNGWECATAFSIPNTIRETPRTFLVFKKPDAPDISEEIEKAKDLASQASPPYCPPKSDDWNFGILRKLTPEQIHDLT